MGKTVISKQIHGVCNKYSHKFYSHTLTHRLLNMYSRTCIHGRSNTHTHKLTHSIHPCEHTNTNKNTHTKWNTATLTSTHTCTHIHTHAHAFTHTYTNTHTHTLSLSLSLSHKHTWCRYLSPLNTLSHSLSLLFSSLKLSRISSWDAPFHSLPFAHSLKLYGSKVVRNFVCTSTDQKSYQQLLTTPVFVKCSELCLYVNRLQKLPTVTNLPCFCHQMAAHV